MNERQSSDTPKADFHKFRNGKICEFYDTAHAIAQANDGLGWSASKRYAKASP